MYEMKKVIVATLFTILAVCLTGCGKADVAIEDCKWELTVIQSGKDGSIVGCSSESYEIHKDVEGIKVVDLILTAQNGNFTISDSANGKIYNGTYKVNISKKNCMIYDIVMGEESGHATTAYTEHKNETGTVQRIPTLIVSVGDYSLTFQHKLATEE